MNLSRPVQHLHRYFDEIFRCTFMSETFKKISGHGAFPLAIGILLAATGSSAMMYRFVGLLICALWFSLDVGIWIAKANRTEFWKHWLFCATTYLWFLFAMLAMEGILKTSLADERNDVFQNLMLQHSLISGSEDDPMRTMFTVKNNSHYDISRKHQLNCYTHLAVSMGDAEVSNISSRRLPVGWECGLIPRILSDSILSHGGDGQSEDCLGWYNFEKAGGTSCADVDVVFWYSLQSQPDFDQEKKFRLVAYRGKDGRFQWLEQPVDKPGSFCEQYIPKRPPPR